MILLAIWEVMRQAAIARHQILHEFLHDDWEPHAVMIKNFYGY